MISLKINRNKRTSSKWYSKNNIQIVEAQSTDQQSINLQHFQSNRSLNENPKTTKKQELKI